MVETIANVLTGVATLEVKEPHTHRAEWSDEQAETGTYTVKLSKPGTEGGYCSTHVQFTPTGAAAALVITDLEGAAADWGWSHFRSAIAAYWEQMELRFEDPDTTAWVDITIQMDVMATGGAEWVPLTVTAATDWCFFGGWSEQAGSFSNYALTQIDVVSAAIETAENAAGGIIANADNWVLTRVRMELWETVWERYVYIDDVILDSQTFTLEPGGTTAGIRLSSAFTEVGYTEDGVTITYTADTADIEVEEETFPIDNVITKETAEVTCNMAESSLFNMDKAMAGSLLSGSILKLGAGTQKKISLQIRATNPASFIRAIQIPSCVATGAVGMPYKKGEKTVVPVTFRALKTAGHPAVTIVDNAA